MQAFRDMIAKARADKKAQLAKEAAEKGEQPPVFDDDEPKTQEIVEEEMI